MFLVYILKSENRSYIGMTNDFFRRWKQHNNILKGGEKYLKHEKIKSILIELNESFVDQTSNSINILKKNNFELLYKKHSKEFDNSEKYSSIYNYVFKKKN